MKPYLLRLFVMGQQTQGGITARRRGQPAAPAPHPSEPSIDAAFEALRREF